ncbi:lysine--tRNA ligase [Candidatus Kaiserbacteria bacterium]|nr:lysine--tRNA ligase [Candidatus Kaiserbacteria bacterium]
MAIEDLQKIREEKLTILKDAGMDPYPVSVPRDVSLHDVRDKFSEYVDTDKEVSLTGRIMAIRGQGAIMFAVLDDGTARFQAVLKKDTLSEDLFSLWNKAVDIGDTISVTGPLFTTQKGEESLLVSSWSMAAKSLLPLPEKWHGLVDIDERFRKRYLDLLLQEEERDLFYKKSMFWKSMRTFLEDRNFLEVQTPTLETTTGGAEARPFKTHHNDFDMDVFLRISVGELWQKRLMAAGFPKTYEIGRVYRNEGTSPEHLQEFTNMECYAAFMDFEDGKDFIKELYKTVALDTFGTTKFTSGEHVFDFTDEWEDLDYVDTVKKITGVDVLESSEDELKAKLTELGVTYSGENRERLTDSLWKYCRKQISGPAFLINHPKLIAPLSKTHPDDPRKTKTIQVILAGSEVGRAHAELADPQEQRERFEVQEELLKSGDEEAMMPDWEYVEMLEHGMPPTFGLGVGERLFAILAGRTVRETQLFPLMRPKANE